MSSEFRLPRAPASPLIAVILLGVLSAGSAGSQPSERAPVDREAIPDLNRLQKRVLEFWSLVTRGQKYQALSYVAEGQDHFLNWKWPPVESYRVANLEFKEGSHEVVVMVQAVVRPPGFGNRSIGRSGNDGSSVRTPGKSLLKDRSWRLFSGARDRDRQILVWIRRRPSKSSGGSELESAGFISARFCRGK